MASSFYTTTFIQNYIRGSWSSGVASASAAREWILNLPPLLIPAADIFLLLKFFHATLKLFLLTQKISSPLKTFIRTISSNPKVQFCRSSKSGTPISPLLPATPLSWRKVQKWNSNLILFMISFKIISYMIYFSVRNKSKRNAGV